VISPLAPSAPLGIFLQLLPILVATRPRGILNNERLILRGTGPSGTLQLSGWTSHDSQRVPQFPPSPSPTTTPGRPGEITVAVSRRNLIKSHNPDEILRTVMDQEKNIDSILALERQIKEHEGHGKTVI